jgi:hypothetical protein
MLGLQIFSLARYIWFWQFLILLATYGEAKSLECKIYDPIVEFFATKEKNKVENILMKICIASSIK